VAPWPGGGGGGGGGAMPLLIVETRRKFVSFVVRILLVMHTCIYEWEFYFSSLFDNAKHF
jgi:hypothetical protein